MQKMNKELFYEQLQSIVEKVNKHDLLIITGDMNAKVGSSNHNRERVMAKHGAAIMNSNGERLIDFCEINNNLVITGTIFPHKDIHKNTWTSPDGKTHNQIDYILVTQQFRRFILDTRVTRGADVASDHRLVQTRVRLELKRITKPTSSRTRYHVDKLRYESVRKELRNRFAVLEAAEDDDHDINSKWAQFSKAYNNTEENVLGRKGKVANHGSALSRGQRSRNENSSRAKQKMLSPKGSNNNYVQNTGVKTRRSRRVRNLIKESGLTARWMTHSMQRIWET